MVIRSSLVVMLNNDAEARAYLEKTPRAWPFLMAVELGYLALDRAARALAMEVGDFYLLQAAAGEKAKAVGKQHTP